MKQKVLKKVIQSILEVKPNAPVEKKYNFDLSVYQAFKWKFELIELFPIAWDFQNQFLIMKPLPTTRRVFSWFCVYHDEASTKWQKLAHISFTSIVFVFLITALISSIGYIFKTISINLEDSLYAVPQISAVVIIKYSLIAMYFSRDKFHEIFYNLSDIYKKCTYYK